MKRILCMAVTIAMILSLINTVVFAADNTLNITVNSQSVKPGETATITLTITENPGFGWLSITPVCNDGFTWKAQNGELSLDIDKGTKNINWSADEDCTELGVLVTLSVTVATDVVPGDYEITFRVNECYNESFDDVPATIASAVIAVICPHTNTINVPETPADCDEGGYTSGVWCNDCETYIRGHEPISATGNHTDANDKWESDEVNHFRTCDCGHIFDTAAHSGGTATCKGKAKCSVCGAEYGQLNATNHAGGTTTVNASEPNHKTQQAGYTGDTKCLGCGEIISYGQTVPADAHTPADVWSGNETHHWKECNTVGCGVVIDDSNAEHISDKTQNKATCQKKAVCDVCGELYGELISHTLEEVPSKSPDCEHSGNHKYYVCGGCGGVYKADGITETTVEAEMIPAKGHNYSAKVTVPTCTEQGYTTHTCACGESYVDTYSAALGHDYGEWYQTKAPTLEAEGEERRDCSRCDDYQTRKLPMLVHSYTSVVTAPTCTEKGYTTHTCTNCGDVYVDSYVAALGHSFTNYTANGDATCTADGTKIAKCDRCDATDTVTDVGSKTGHSMGDWVETKAPTCTEKGTEKIDCANCNHYETRETAAKGHTVVIDKAVEATCTASGLTEGKHCSVCGEVLVSRKEVSAKGHSYTDAVTAPTCTEKGYTTHTCHCGDSYVDTYADALDHAWNEGVVTLEPTEETEGIRLFSCSRCDAEKSEPIHCLNPHIHNYGYSVVVTEATCFQDGYTTYTCNCGASYVDDYVRSHELNLFDDNFSDKFYEKLTKPTCTESGGIFYVCRECGESIQYADIPARGHDLGEWETVREPNYLGNGLKERHCSRCVVFESEEINNNPFTDVGEGSQFKTAILWAYYSGVTSGKTATTFEPDATVTRAQFVTFLWRAAGCPEPETVENPFTDVGEGAYYYKAVMWAVENKITIGTTATTFSPDKLCTRGHVAMFLYRYAGEPVISLHDDRFEDVTPNNRYYKAVMWAIQEEITVGKTATTFGLHQECTRAQVVMFLYRYLEEGKQT